MSVKMIYRIISNLVYVGVEIYKRFAHIVAPKIEEPTAEEKEQVCGKLVAPSAEPYDFEVIDRAVFVVFMSYVLGGFYGGYVCLTQAKLLTIIFSLSMVVASVLGITVGVHRLWSHRAFKARAPLQVLLLCCHLLSNQHSVVTWVRTHRLHHQCSDTDADPHNATRGLFFSHFWWMLTTPHPEVQKRLKLVDVSDLMNNPLIRFQEKYASSLIIILSYIIPTLIPTLWGESLYVAAMSNLFRQNIVLHIANSINSVAHLVGYKPVDTSVAGTQFPLVGALALGEGFHNYHHAFPSDYRASEFGDTKLNLSALFIELMAKIGWAYDLKVTSEEVVRNRVLAKGDGSDQHYLTDESRTQQQEFFCMKFYKDFKTT